MSITVNIYYSGKNGSARQFAREMMESGTVAAIREEPGNLQYAYFYPVEDEETVLLIDSWENQEAIDAHHHTPMMQKIMELREKFDLHMRVLRFVAEDCRRGMVHLYGSKIAPAGDKLAGVCASLQITL